MFFVFVYRSKPFADAPAGHWFVRIAVNGSSAETPVTQTYAQTLIAMGVPQLPDGGGH